MEIIKFQAYIVLKNLYNESTQKLKVTLPDIKIIDSKNVYQMSLPMSVSLLF